LLLSAALVAMVGVATACADEAGETVSARRGGEPSGDAGPLLASVREAVDEAGSFRFRFTGVDTTMAYWDGAERRFTGEGAWSADRWRLLTSDQNSSSETIRDGETIHDRRPEPGESLEQAPWESWEAWEDEPSERADVLSDMAGAMEQARTEDAGPDGHFLDQAVDGLGVALAAGDYLDGSLERVDWGDLEVGIGDFPDDPAGFVEVLGRGGSPRLLSEDGSGGTTTLGLTLRAGDDAVAAFGAPIPDGDLEVDVGADHLPTALRLRVSGGDQSFQIEVTFSDWAEQPVL
jgi:hypothetical protein